MLSNFPAEQSLAGSIPEATVFLSCLTSRAGQRIPQGVPAQQAPLGLADSRAMGTAAPRVGERVLGAVDWGFGSRGCPRTAAPRPSGTAVTALRTGARSRAARSPHWA